MTKENKNKIRDIFLILLYIGLSAFLVIGIPILFLYGQDFNSGLESTYGIVTEKNEKIIKKITNWGKWEYIWVGEIENYQEYMERQEGDKVTKLQMKANDTTLNTKKKKVAMVALYQFHYSGEHYVEISFYQNGDTYVACYRLHPEGESD